MSSTTLTALIAADPDGTIRPSGGSDPLRGLWWKGILDRLDGAMLEYFGTDATEPYGNQTRDEFTDWCLRMGGYATNVRRMPTIIVGRSSTRSAGSTSDDPANATLRTSALAHYLMFANENTAFRWADKGGYTDVVIWPDEFLKIRALGNPRGVLYQPDRLGAPHVWRRDFDAGYVDLDHSVSGSPTNSITFAF
jgi:hypothetical protein